MKCKQREEVEKFCKIFLVDVDLVDSALHDLKSKSIFKDVQAKERRSKWDIEDAKLYQDYNWKELIETGDLRKMVIKLSDRWLTNRVFLPWEHA